MAVIEDVIATCRQAAENPGAVLDAHLAAGKKVVGVGPYHMPEELVTAAGAVPFGVWGRVGAAEEARKYFPPFYCSLCQTTLEMGIDGTLDKLCGFMTSGLCDTLRAASQNYKVGMHIPQIYVTQPQNRTCDAGKTYAVEAYKEAKRRVEEATGTIITDEALAKANQVHNAWRATMREFVKQAGLHPAEVGVADRVAVINAGYYMDKAEHTALVDKLNAALAELPASQDGFTKVVLSGIYEDIPALEQILADNGYAVVADDLAKESRAFGREVPEQGDPLEALAMSFVNITGDSILYDPQKTHVQKVVDLARENGADGVVLFLAKFCDPEEFDAPLVMQACKEAGIPAVSVEVDQCTESYGQARTKLETFKDLM
jgi:bcr-type benzoyl-CoA reductase subunit C